MSSYFVKQYPAIEEHMGFNLYEGYMLNDIKEGPGRYKWADGHVTIGDWKNGDCPAFTAELQKRCPQSLSGIVTRAKVYKSAPKSSKVEQVKKKAVNVCISCKTQCTFTFQCLNCNAGYCEGCDKRYEVQGFKKKRPPCKCMIYEDGRAVDIQIVPMNKLDIFDVWNVHEVRGHFLDRKVSISAKHLIFNISFSHRTIRGLKCTTLCEVGSMNALSQTKLFEHQSVKDYVTTCTPKPAAFEHLEKRWKTPAKPRPPLSLNTKCYDCDWASLFTEGRKDVDSLQIKSFFLTETSIAEQLLTFVPRQLDVGTVWSSVKPPPGYSTLCGPRPTMMVYVGIFRSMKARDIRKVYANYLTTKTGRYFNPAVTDGSSMFNTSKGSIDTSILVNEWLRLIHFLQHCICHEDEENELEKMRLMHITYHGWKSYPDEIQNGFTSINLFEDCKNQNLTRKGRTGAIIAAICACIFGIAYSTLYFVYKLDLQFDDTGRPTMIIHNRMRWWYRTLQTFTMCL